MGKARAQDKEAKVTQIALRISHIEKFVSARKMVKRCEVEAQKKARSSAAAAAIAIVHLQCFAPTHFRLKLLSLSLSLSLSPSLSLSLMEQSPGNDDKDVLRATRTA